MGYNRVLTQSGKSGDKGDQKYKQANTATGPDMTMGARARLPDALFEAIVRELDAHPEGLCEQAFIRALHEQGFFAFLPPPPAPPEPLFQAHFILFHALYRLDERLVSERRGRLQIDPLCIRRLPGSAGGGSALGRPDGLRDYYLDWRNLAGMSEGGVQRLLDRFWTRFGRRGRREQALAELGLADPVSDEAIKRAWRRLAMIHHPDRGGDGVRLQAINQAADSLLGRP